MQQYVQALAALDPIGNPANFAAAAQLVARGYCEAHPLASVELADAEMEAINA